PPPATLPCPRRVRRPQRAAAARPHGPQRGAVRLALKSPPQTVSEIFSTPAALPSPILRRVSSPSTRSAAPLQPWLRGPAECSRPALGACVHISGERIAGGGHCVAPEGALTRC